MLLPRGQNGLLLHITTGTKLSFTYKACKLTYCLRNLICENVCQKGHAQKTLSVDLRHEIDRAVVTFSTTECSLNGFLMTGRGSDAVR